MMSFPQERSRVLQRSQLMGAVATVIALVATAPNAQADSGDLRLNSTMTAECLDTECTVVRFKLNVDTDAFVGWLRITTKDTDYRFGEVLNVVDRFGNGVAFTSVVSDDGIMLTELAAFGSEPLYLTVQMAQAGDRSQVNGFTYSGAVSSADGGNGSIYRIDGPVGLAPEPMSIVLLGTGLAGIAGAAARRRKRNAGAS